MQLSLKQLSHSQTINLVRGMTLIEVLVAIVIVGALGAITAPNIMRMGSKPLPDTANQVAGVFRSARAMAIAQTSPVKVKPAQRVVNANGTSTGGLNNQFEIWRASNSSTACNSETGWTRINNSLVSGSLDFAKGIRLVGTRVDGAVLSVPTGWEVCFNTRGVASTKGIKSNSFRGSNIILTLEKTSDGDTQRPWWCRKVLNALV